MQPLPGEDALGRQFLRLQRELVESGRWARLWRADRGLGASLCPVLALLSWGYDEADARLRRLTTLAGITGAEAQRARLALLHSGLIELLAGKRRGVWRFRVGAGLLESRRRRGVIVPGKLIASGLWAALDPAQRSLLITLAGLARTYWGLEETYYRGDGVVEDESGEDEYTGIATISAEPFDDDEEFAMWLADIDAVWNAQEGPACVVHRVGMTTLTELAALSGIGDCARTEAALQALQDNPQATLVEVCPDSCGVAYHLPSSSWHIPRSHDASEDGLAQDATADEAWS